ncbi:hypothetical protein G6F22_015455 [Rhizopus arrhizus]|nr:hypothetical protein G6F22_015455 [Rhizopus arrhizus]
MDTRDTDDQAHLHCWQSRAPAPRPAKRHSVVERAPARLLRRQPPAPWPPAPAALPQSPRSAASAEDAPGTTQPSFWPLPARAGCNHQNPQPVAHQTASEAPASCDGRNPADPRARPALLPPNPAAAGSRLAGDQAARGVHGLLRVCIGAGDDPARLRDVLSICPASVRLSRGEFKRQMRHSAKSPEPRPHCPHALDIPPRQRAGAAQRRCSSSPLSRGATASNGASCRSTPSREGANDIGNMS